MEDTATSNIAQELDVRVKFAVERQLGGYGEAARNTSAQVFGACDDGFKSRYLQEVINFDGTRAKLVVKSLESKVSKLEDDRDRFLREIERLSILTVKAEVERSLCCGYLAELRKLISDDQNLEFEVREKKKQLKRKQQAEREELLLLEAQAKKNRRLQLTGQVTGQITADEQDQNSKVEDIDMSRLNL